MRSQLLTVMTNLKKNFKADWRDRDSEKKFHADWRDRDSEQSRQIKNVAWKTSLQTRGVATLLSRD